MSGAVSPTNNPLVRRKVGRARVLNETPVEEATPSAAGESYHPASHAFIAMTVCDVSLDLARSRLLRPACDVPLLDDVAATPRSFAQVCLPCHRTVTG